MGLLTQALAGGVAAAADTTATIMVDNNRAAQQSERDAANALREENLRITREAREAKREGEIYTRNQDAELAKEERAFSRGESGMVNAEGVPLTRAEAEAARKQDAAAADAEPVKPGLISAAKYGEENTISKDFTDPDGKIITVAEAKRRQKEGLPLKLREDVEHERTRKEKGEDRGEDLKDYKKKKDIDTAAALRLEKEKATRIKKEVEDMTPSVAAETARKLMEARRESGQPLEADEQMLLDLALKRAKGGADSPPKKHPLTGNGIQMPIPPRGQQPKAAAPNLNSKGFSYVNGKLVPN